MKLYDFAILVAAVLVALAMLIGIKELAYVVRRARRRYRVAADLAEMRAGRPRIHPMPGRRATVPAVPAVPAPDARAADREAVK